MRPKGLKPWSRVSGPPKVNKFLTIRGAFLATWKHIWHDFWFLSSKLSDRDHYFYESRMSNRLLNRLKILMSRSEFDYVCNGSYHFIQELIFYNVSHKKSSFFSPDSLIIFFLDNLFSRRTTWFCQEVVHRTTGNISLFRALMSFN